MTKFQRSTMHGHPPPHLVQPIRPEGKTIFLRGHKMGAGGMPARGWIMFLILAFALPIGIGFIFAAGVEHLDLSLVALPMLIIIYSAWCISFDLGGPVYDYGRQFLYVYLYANFGVGPIAQLITRQFPWQGDYSDSEIIFSYIVVAAGIAAFELASRILGRTAESAQTSKLRNGETMPKAIIFLAVGMGLVGPAIFFALGYKDVVFQTRVEAGEAVGNQLGSSVWYQIVVKTMYCWPLLAGVLLMLTRVSHNAFKRMVQTVTASAFLGFALLVGNPLSAPRYWFATAFVAAAAAIVYSHAPRLLKLFPIAIVFGYLIVFPLAAIYRDSYSFDRFQQARGYGWRDNYRNAFLKGDFDSLQQLMNTVRVVESDGVQGGRQILGTFLFWVPREYWPDKPINTGEFVAQRVGYAYTNLSSPLWAEGYLDFHIFGTLGFLFIFGTILRKARERCETGGNGASVVKAFVLVFAPYSVFLLRGGLLSAFAYISPAIGMCVFLLIALKSHSVPNALVRVR